MNKYTPIFFDSGSNLSFFTESLYKEIMNLLLEGISAKMNENDCFRTKNEKI